MTDPRPIGVFDSGVGGLTVLRALKAALPSESTIYLGDTARVPYGTRSASTVIKYAQNCARTLVAQADIKLLVVACNTVSAVALEALRAELPIPVVGVIDAGARAARAAAPSAKGASSSIAVLGTAGTTKSGAYPRALAAQGHTGVVTSIKAPLFVPLAEEGWTSGDVPLLAARRYLEATPADVDVVVLGCTHYPLLAPMIQRALTELRPGAIVVDGAAATCDEVRAVLAAQSLSSTLPSSSSRSTSMSSSSPRHRLLVTDAPEQMVQLAPAFLGAAVRVEDVELVDITMTA